MQSDFVGVLGVILLVTADCYKHFVKENNDAVVIFSGELRIVLYRADYHMQVYDNTTGSLIIAERADDTNRLGYGRWEGVYFNLYEGYFWRLGDIQEWYVATHILSVSSGPNNVTAYIATNDPKNRTLELTLYDLQERQFSYRIAMPDSAMNRIKITLDSPAVKEERFYGFGERFNSLDQRFFKVGGWSEDGSFDLGKLFPGARIPGGATATYAPMPLFLSSAGYAYQIHTTYRTEFDFEKVTLAGMMVESNVFTATLYAGRSVRDSFRMLSNVNGKSLIPPKWAFGPWNQLTSEVQNVNASTRAKEMLLKEDIPISLNIHTVHFFPGGDERSQIPQILSENEELLNLGIPSSAYFNPMIETSYNGTYQDAAKQGFFTKNQSGLPYEFLYVASQLFKVSQVDFTNSNAVSWYQKHLQRGIDLKYKGWMYDYGEYTPTNSINFLNQTGLESHNEYPVLYQKACFDFLTANNTPESPYAPNYLYYVRSGYVGSQKYTWAHWTGDPSSDWSRASGLVAQMMASLNIGISGMPFSGSDIGGFEWFLERPPSLELWVRWTQLGTFSGLMHEQGGGKGIGPKTHIFDTPEGTRLWRKFAKLRTQLFPYIYTQAHIAHETGLPIMRAHILDFPDDVSALVSEFQYMFGESILIAPVLIEGMTYAMLYLPANESWIDIGSNLTYDEADGRFRIGYSRPVRGGESVSVEVPLDKVPLFVRAGTIIPAFDPRVQVLSPAAHPNVTSFDEVKILHLWSWPDMEWRSYGYDWQNNTFGTQRLASAAGLQVNLNVTSSNYDTVVCQVAVGNETKLITQVKPSTGGEQFDHVTSWKDVVAVGSRDAWATDEMLGTLWIKTMSKSIILDILYQ